MFIFDGWVIVGMDQIFESAVTTGLQTDIIAQGVNDDDRVLSTPRPPDLA
jgi:hypothetical protein